MSEDSILGNIERDWRAEERAKWDAMTEDARFDMHMAVRANRADAKQAADRLDHQLQGAVEENERLREWIAASSVAMQARHAGIITPEQYGEAQRRRFGGQ